jgi:hypothetical protein
MIPLKNLKKIKKANVDHGVQINNIKIFGLISEAMKASI